MSKKKYNTINSAGCSSTTKQLEQDAILPEDIRKIHFRPGTFLSLRENWADLNLFKCSKSGYKAHYFKCIVQDDYGYYFTAYVVDGGYIRAINKTDLAIGEIVVLEEVA